MISLGIFGVEQLEEIQRDAKGQAPDGLAAVEDRGKFAGARGGALAGPLVVAAILRVAKGSEGDVEDFGDLGQLWPERRVGRDDADEGSDDDAAGGGVHRGEIADDVHRGGRDADFLVRLAQGRIEEGRIDGIDAAAGKGDLAAMAGDTIGAADIDDMEFAAPLEHRDEHRGGIAIIGERLARRRSNSRELAPDGLDVAGERREVGHGYR